MKKILPVLLAAALLLFPLSACGNTEGPSLQEPVSPSVSGTEEASVPPAQTEEVPSARELVNLILTASNDGGAENLESFYVEEDRELLSAYIENAYGLQDPWEDAAVIRAKGASAFEIAVLRMEDEDAAARAAETLKGYLAVREGDFTGYAPAEADMAANGEIRQSGAYVGLFICPNAKAAASAFEKNLDGGTAQAPGGEDGPSETDAKLAELLDEALDYCAEYGEDVSQLERLDCGDPDALESYIKDVYGVSDEVWETCQGAAAAKGPEGSVFQAAVFRMGTDNPERAGMELIRALHAYLDDLESRSEDPALTELLHEVQAFYTMKHCFLILSGCYKDIQFHMVDLLNGRSCSSMTRHWGEQQPSSTPAPTPDPSHPDRVLFTPPNQEDMSFYDTSAIRAAWEKGDPSSLTKYDRAVYDAAKQALDGIITEGMDDLEKETAIYHWIVYNVDYDWRHQDALEETPRSSYEPYGGLVDRTAVCLGYATTFQLLCDLSGVECITVAGASSDSQEDHAWNMVRLDGRWYCVDVTWDANNREFAGRGGPGDWKYFNVTSGWMAQTDHQWDYAGIPETGEG